MIDRERVKEKVADGLAAQFSSCYTWEDMIDDCNLNAAERQWAKAHLTYKVEES